MNLLACNKPATWLRARARAPPLRDGPWPPFIYTQHPAHSRSVNHCERPAFRSFAPQPRRRFGYLERNKYRKRSV